MVWGIYLIAMAKCLDPKGKAPKARGVWGLGYGFGD